MNKSNIKAAAIGVDLGGTNLRLGIVDQKGRILKSLKRPTLAKEGKDRVINRIIDLLREAIEISTQLSVEVKGICIGAPGFLDIKRGIIIESPNLPGWKDVALKKEIEKRAHFPSILIQNDANGFTYGEWWKGAGKGYNSMVGITLGTGVGGGLILDKKIWLGEDGAAGEIGHMIVEPSGLKCQCGRYGCLESYSSGTGIVNRAIMALKKGINSSLINRAEGNFSLITSKMVFEEAVAGDGLSLNIMEEAGRYLGIAVSSLINILNVYRFVIGGRIAGAGDLILKPAREEIFKRALNLSAKGEVIIQASLEDDAGIIGTAGMVFESVNRKTLSSAT
ncbi:MAG: ROK family protein [Desulfobacterales bacterium]|nr:ROK family protein [Desulfobacterales bacterium]